MSAGELLSCIVVFELTIFCVPAGKDQVLCRQRQRHILTQREAPRLQRGGVQVDLDFARLAPRTAAAATHPAP